MAELNLKNLFILLEHYGESSVIYSSEIEKLKKFLFNKNNFEKKIKNEFSFSAINKLKSKEVREKTEEKASYNSLLELYDVIKNFECDLKKFSKNTVIFDGEKDSKIMIIGEGPGAEEDEAGKPFVGQSGKLLNLMLSSVGLTREKVYITNVVNWRPPGNRTPTDDEINLFKHFLFSHVSLINPKIILLLGGTALKAFFGPKISLSSMRNKIHDFSLGEEYNNKNFKIILTFHPSYLLRSPSQKSFAYLDMLLLKRSLMHMNIF